MKFDGGLARLRRTLDAIRKVASSNDGDDDHTVDFVTCYKCNSCLLDIPNGQDRYHCEECDHSFDLCSGCYHTEAFDVLTGRRSGKQHTDKCGASHTFIMETRPPQVILAKVHGSTLQATFLNMFTYYSQRKCLGVRDKATGHYVWNRFCDLQEAVNAVATGLTGLTAGKKSRSSTPLMVAICGISSAEWYTAQLACMLLGKPTVPILTTVDETILQYILDQTDLQVAFCTQSNRAKFEAVCRKNPGLKLRTLIVMDAEEKFAVSVEGCPQLSVVSWRELIRQGNSRPRVDLQRIKPSANSIYTIMYTSGSTGTPKGCVFSRELYNNSLKKFKPTWLRTHGCEVWFSFQPPAHSTDHRMVLGTLTNGGRVGFYRGDMQHVFEDIGEVQPTIVACTPRFWTMLFNQYQKEIMTATLGAKQRLQREQAQSELHDAAAGNSSAAQAHQANGDARSSGQSEAEQSIPLQASSTNSTKPENATGASERMPSSTAIVEEEDTSTAPETVSVTETGALPEAAGQDFTPFPDTMAGFPPNEHLSPAAQERLEHEKLSKGLQRQLSGDESAELAHRSSIPEVLEDAIRASVQKRFSRVLGGRCNVIVTGGAATGRAVLKFLQSTFSSMVSDGYGATEVGAIAQDGHIAPSADVKLIDVPEMGYLISDDPPRGEICVKTPTMISGYYRNEAETKEKFVDGYFRTGDIGVRDLRSGNVKIIDRKKNFFKLSQGEFVAPERLESLLVDGSAYVSQVFVYGESEEDRVVAVVVPEKDVLCSWWTGSSSEEAMVDKVDDDEYVRICNTDKVNRFLLSEVRRLAESSDLPGWEVPCRLLVEPVTFGAENGLLTETSKPCRPKLQVRYRQQLQQLYLDYNEEKLRFLSSDVQRLIADATGLPVDGSDASLSQKGVDSLLAVKLSSLLLDQLDINISASLLVSMPAEKIVQHVCTLKAPIGNRAEASLSSLARPHLTQDVDWAAECVLDAGVCLAWKLSDLGTLSAQDPVSVLLTGAGGFLGAHVLRRLLSVLPACHVTCVVREGTVAEDGSRSCSALEQSRGKLLQRLTSLEPPLTSSDSQRICVVLGDLGQPLLGIGQEEFDRLCQSVDVVIHNAAEVSSAKPYRALHSVNVSSTVDILKLVASGRPKRLHFVSSTGIFGSQPKDGLHTEEDAVMRARLPFLTGYSQTKYVCEELLRTAAVQRGFPVSVSRPGLIGADSVTGDSNHRDWLYWLVRGSVELGVCPGGVGCDDKPMDVVNVDYVAAAIVHAAVAMTEGGVEQLRILHLVPDSRAPVCTWSVLVGYLRQLGYKMSNADYSTFRQRVLEASHSGHVTPSSLLLLLPAAGSLPQSQRYAGEATRSALATAGLSLEPAIPDQDYHLKYFMRLVADAALPGPKGRALEAT